MDNEYFSSINDVARQLSIPAHTLRYWEKQFPVAIRPTTGAGGRRYYRSETVARLAVIKELLYNHGMTIAGVKKMLRDGTLPETVDAIATPGAHAPAAAAVKKSAPADIDAAIELLTQARDLLK